jgi:hypothetical protein
MVNTDVRNRYADIGQAVDRLTNTQPEVEFVRESYRRLMETEESQRKFFRSFYVRFLNEWPKAKPFFSKFGELKKTGKITPEWERQFQALKEAVLLLIVFKAFREGERSINILTRIVDRHAKGDRPIPSGLYEPFGEVLATVAAIMDEHAPISQEERWRAWNNVIGPGIEHMRRRTEEIAARGD